jgi:uncharacterized protein YbbC (DUF1343 family)
VNASWVATEDVLAGHRGLLELSALFGPQHGFHGHTQDNMIEWSGFRHPRLGIPVHSLYGENREPTDAMLNGLDALLIDLQDIGCRVYTFIWTMYLCLRACERAMLPVAVVDRPNPITADTVEGPVLDQAYASFVGLHPIPLRHGLTIGELAEKFRAEAFPKLELHVLAMSGWQRGWWYDQTGLPWVLPSPNMPALETAVVYPGMVLLEGTNLSEGRGTTRPFELFGAPWIDAWDLCAGLDALGLPGVRFRRASFQPTFQKFAGQLCHGSQLHVTDRNRFRPVQTALEILIWIAEHYPNEFRWKLPPYEYEAKKLPIDILLGHDHRKTFGTR